ncbi:MAG: TrmH family RNA methyltransferase [Gammaproteobacteria bacterium]|nr:TrmH family RNA methyltransferase [Gammaproteobacteria bacterium]
MNNTIVSIGLSNPKSPDNVNSVRRAAGNYRVDSIYYTGSRYPRALKLNPGFAKINRDVSLSIPVNSVDDLFDQVTGKMQIVCVEFAQGAIPLPEFKHPDNVMYIFGPEDGTLSQEIIDSADSVVYIPTIGCMNLAATVNVVLYDRLSKSSINYANEELISNSRDTNNNLKVKA